MFNQSAWREATGNTCTHHTETTYLNIINPVRKQWEFCIFYVVSLAYKNTNTFSSVLVQFHLISTNVWNQIRNSSNLKHQMVCNPKTSGKPSLETVWFSLNAEKLLRCSESHSLCPKTQKLACLYIWFPSHEVYGFFWTGFWMNGWKKVWG